MVGHFFSFVQARFMHGHFGANVIRHVSIIVVAYSGLIVYYIGSTLSSQIDSDSAADGSYYIPITLERSVGSNLVEGKFYKIQ